MAKLSYKQKKSFAPKVYGLPKVKKYPMPDVAHARDAKARASAQYKKGNLTRGELITISRKANRIIKAAGGKPAPVKK
jgi:hypothetical protein